MKQISKGWIAVSHDEKGRLYACSLSSMSMEEAKDSVIESLAGREIRVFSEVTTQKGLELAAEVERAPLLGGKSIRLAFDGMTCFEKDVYQWVRNIPRGKVASYGDVASGVGKPRAARAVGNVMAKNPFLMVVPCHRVVKSNMMPGGFGLNPGEKVRLLMDEGIQISGGRIRAIHRLAPGK